MGIYDKFKNAQMSKGSGNYIQAGGHILQIETCKFDATRKGIDFFAAEFTILKTDSDHPNMKPGMHVSWLAMGDQDAYAGNVKRFICGVYGVDEAEINDMTSDDFENLMNEITKEKQVFANKLVRVEAKIVKTRAGNDFTRVDFYEIPESDYPKYR